MKDLKNFLIKREQSQARLRFAKCEKSRLLARTLLTLVALFAMTTGAWADNTETVNITAATVNGTNVTVTATFYNSDTGAWMSYKGETIVVTSKDGSNFEQLVLNIKNNEINAGDVKASVGTCTVDGKKITVTGINASSVTFSNDDSSISISSVEVTFAAPTGTPVPLTWTEATKTATLTNGMPAGNVTVSVEYFPQAAFAMSTDATPVALAPTAIANVPANTDAPIVTPGTVANIGESEVKQGTLKYFVKQADGNTAPTAPDYDDEGWTDKVPTANKLKQGDVYVWYYIEGAEPATIADRTDDNTRSDSDIKPLGASGIVTLLPEPTYDVSLNKTGMAEGEPALWSAKSTNVAEVNLGEADLEGVKKSETVTVTYSGTKKIIGVKAEKKSATITLDNTINAWTAGTYAVPAGGLTYSDAITVSGDVTLTLTDGEELTLNKGISLAEGATLTVEGNGTMNINGTNGNSSSTVAGSGMMCFKSGTLVATGGNGHVGNDLGQFGQNGGISHGGSAINGSLTLEGGNVTATGGNGGNAGGAYINWATGGNGGSAITGNVIINGGNWTANDGSNGTLLSGGNNNVAGTGGKAVAGTVTDNR